MRIAAIRLWQWALISLLAGPLIAFIHLCCRQIRGFPGRSVHQVTFERMLSMQEPPGNAYLTNIVVHPHPTEIGSYVVTAEHRDNADRISSYWFEAITPYRATTGGVPEASVVSYLEHVHRQTPNLSYRVAWWQHPGWLVTFYTLAAVAIGTGLCPLIVRHMFAGPDLEPPHSPLTTALNPENADAAAVGALNENAASLMTAISVGTLHEFVASEDDYYPTERRRREGERQTFQSPVINRGSAAPK